MSDRILNLQRRARELGRLRGGIYDEAQSRPVRLDTWVITSLSEDYIRAAAEFWGGDVHEYTPQSSTIPQWRLISEAKALDAILPPGDPLSQFYEKWNKGGCERRCNGATEQLSDQPCVCRSQFGEQFHERDARQVCQITSRLNVILPQMPDIGVWRLETHSYYAATELAAHVDLIRASVSDQYAVPIRVRIEQRSRRENGKTKKYSVPIVELRGVVAAQVLAGSIPPAIANEPEMVALETSSIVADVPERLTEAKVLALAALCKSPQQVNRLWEDAKADGILTDDLKAFLVDRGRELGGRTKAETEVVEDKAKSKREADRVALALEAARAGVRDVLEVRREAVATAAVEAARAGDLWAEILAHSPYETMVDLNADFQATLGKTPSEATPAELAEYLDLIKAG